MSIGEVLAAAAAAPEPAQAFWVALQAALRRLIPTLSPDRAACLCISEEGGGHPLAIATTLMPSGDGWRLTGTKLWSTGGVVADDLIVVAKAGERDGRPDLRAARVDGRTTGLSRTPLPGLSLLPTLEHARVVFDDVCVAEADVLPGDAYLQIVRPFRTVEDIFVGAGLLGWLLGASARAAASSTVRSPLLAAALGLPALAELPHSQPATHAALAAWQAEFAGIVARFEDACLLPQDAERWRRDRAVLGIAARARAVRDAKAWAAFGLTSPSAAAP